MNKPNGQYKLSNVKEETLSFVRALNVRKCPGIGKVTEQMLISMGIEKVGDIVSILYILDFCSFLG
jgi:DNA polymerase kappa